MDPLVVAFGTALVSAMTTETWQQARASVVALWQRLRPPQRTAIIEDELDALHDQAVTARQDGRVDTEQALAGVWQGRLQELLLADPGLAPELQRILWETLAPMSPAPERERGGRVVMTGRSHDNSVFTQIGGDQYNFRP